MKASPRRKARELAVQGLYQWQVASAEPGDVIAHLAELEGYSGSDKSFLKAAIAGVVSESPGLREQLEPLADRKWAEVSPIESAILLLAAWELWHCPETPYRVILNEAIELAKRYGGTDGHKYVNGILDRLAPLARADEVAARKKAPA